MKKILMVLCLGMISLPASGLYAHSPDKVVLSYDPEGRSLTVEAIHPVADPGRHFVNRLEVSLNGEKVLQTEPPRQNATGMKEVYLLTDATPGDIVQVTAFCNRGGDRTGQIQIPSTDQP